MVGRARSDGGRRHRFKSRSTAEEWGAAEREKGGVTERVGEEKKKRVTRGWRKREADGSVEGATKEAKWERHAAGNRGGKGHLVRNY